MQSGTGVYYQALPAVGPDGKNVMKLIPVKKVNGHFVHSHAPPSRNICLPAHTSTVPLPQNKIPTLQPTADGRFILKTPLEVNTVFNSVKSQHRGPNAFLQSPANQVPVPLITHNMTPNVLKSPVQPNNPLPVPVTNSTQLPNTVKPSALPSGRYLQIPSNATVRTLSASELPSSIKNRICHSKNDSSPMKGLPTVLYVSPVSSLKLDQKSAGIPNPSEPPQTLSHTSAAQVVKSPEESPKSNQGGTIPMKWVVEERAGSSAPYLIPVTSPNMSSEILKAVKHMESSRFTNQVPQKSVSTNVNKDMVTPGNDSALVMCNGKVYLVAKKNSEFSKNMLTNVESKLQPINSAQATALGTSDSNTSQKQEPKSPVDNKKPHDIIDLCDDDEENSTTASEHDDDSNVIFVSYIPPKSAEPETSKEVTETTSVSSYVNDTDTTLDTENMGTGGDLNRTSSAELDASKCNAVDERGPALDRNETPSEKLLVCGQQTDTTDKSFVEMVPDQMYQSKSDSELRQTFGITADLSVSVEKIDVSKESQALEYHALNEKRLINKRTLDGIRKLIRDSKINTKIKQLIQTQVPKPVKTGKKKRLESNGEKEVPDAHSSPLSYSLVESVHEIQSASSAQTTDRQDFEMCPDAEEDSGHTHTAKSQSDSLDCCSGLRKTPPRSSKGCGRVCTACPCGTKVGGMTVNSASKPREKPNLCSGINSAKSEPVSDEPIVDRLADSVLSLKDKNALRNSGEETTPGSQLHVGKDVKGSVPVAAISTGQPEVQPAMTGTCSSSLGSTQDSSWNKSTICQLETATQNASILKTSTQNEVKAVSSSDRKLSYTSYQIPSELFSSVLLDPEEIKRQERIKRLKDLLEEKEAALEKLKKNM